MVPGITLCTPSVGVIRIENHCVKGIGEKEALGWMIAKSSEEDKVLYCLSKGYNSLDSRIP